MHTNRLGLEMPIKYDLGYEAFDGKLAVQQVWTVAGGKLRDAVRLYKGEDGDGLPDVPDEKELDEARSSDASGHATAGSVVTERLVIAVLLLILFAGKLTAKAKALFQN
jgi:hypothetical protein